MAPRALVGLPPTPQRDGILAGLETDGFEVSLAPPASPHQTLASGLSADAPEVIVTFAGSDDPALLEVLRQIKARGATAALLVVDEAGAAPSALLEAGAACVLRSTDSYDAVAAAIAH